MIESTIKLERGGALIMTVRIAGIDDQAEAKAWAADVLKVDPAKLGDGRLYVGHYWSDHGDGEQGRWRGPYSRFKGAVADAIASRYGG